MSAVDLESLPGPSPKAVCEALYGLAADVPSDLAIVEIGVHKGRSLCHLAAGSRDGAGAHVWGIDPWDLPGDRRPYNSKKKGPHAFTSPATRRAAEEAVDRHEFSDRVTLVRGFGREEAARWSGPKVGLLFVDGDHSQAAADVEAWWPHLVDGAAIAFDDYTAEFAEVVEDVNWMAFTGRVAPIQVVCGQLAVTVKVDDGD